MPLATRERSPRARRCSLGLHPGAVLVATTLLMLSTGCREKKRYCPGAATCQIGPGTCDPETGEAVFELKPAGTVCRVAAGPCDVDEVCDGKDIWCPEDSFLPAGEPCGPAASDVCDLPDVCDGVSSSCAPRFASSSVLCRDSRGDCDPSERCTGASPSCPPDALWENEHVCRPGAGPCDLSERCDGVSPACPDDALAAAGTACGELSCSDGAAFGPRCDATGNCLPASSTPCAPFACGEGDCRTSCGSSADCGPGLFCLRDTCLSRTDYIERWDGGDAGATGLSLVIGADGSRTLAAEFGRQVIVYSQPAAATNWERQVAGFPATKPRMAVDASGVPHVVYEEPGTERIVYGTRSGTTWASNELGFGSDPSIALDARGEPHVAYHAFLGLGSVNHHVARVDGEWVSEPISSGGSMACGCINDPMASCSCGKEPGEPQLNLGAAGRLRVLFPRYGTYQGLEFGERTAEGWQFANIEASGFLDGSTALARSATGASHIVYAVLGDTLRVASDESGAWVKSETGLHTSGGAGLAVDAAGHRHLCLFDGALFYATDASGAWARTQVDTEVRNGRVCAAAIDPRNQTVIIAYSTGDTGHLRIATNASGSWEVTLVERGLVYGGGTALAVDASGHPQVTAARRGFLDVEWKDYALTHWRHTGSTLIETPLMSEGGGYSHSALALAADGAPHVVYFQASPAAGLVHARGEAGAWTRDFITTEAVGPHFAQVLDSAGASHVVFNSNGTVVSAIPNGSGWTTTAIEQLYNVEIALALDPSGIHHVVYGFHHPRHATDASGAWVSTELDGRFLSGLPTALALGADGRLHTVYALAHGAGLWYGVWAQGTWTLEPIAPATPERGPALDVFGNSYAMLLDSTGQPHVFTANGNHELIALRRSGGVWHARVLDQAARSMSGAAAALGGDGRIRVSYVADAALHVLTLPAW